MRNRDVAVVGLSVGFSIVCLIWGTIWLIIAKDLSDKVVLLEKDVINCELELEQERQDFKWQLEQIDWLRVNNIKDE